MQEEEEAKHRRRNRQQDYPSIVRNCTNRSGKSQEPPGPTDQERNPNKPFNIWAVARVRAQRPLGEWLGMTIFTFIGISSNLAAVTSSNEAGTMETQYWAWGFATMMGKFPLRSYLQTHNTIVSRLTHSQVYTSPAAAAAPSSTQPS